MYVHNVCAFLLIIDQKAFFKFFDTIIQNLGFTHQTTDIKYPGQLLNCYVISNQMFCIMFPMI